MNLTKNSGAGSNSLTAHILFFKRGVWARMAEIRRRCFDNPFGSINHRWNRHRIGLPDPCRGSCFNTQCFQNILHRIRPVLYAGRLYRLGLIGPIKGSVLCRSFNGNRIYYLAGIVMLSIHFPVYTVQGIIPCQYSCCYRTDDDHGASGIVDFWNHRQKCATRISGHIDSLHNIYSY